MRYVSTAILACSLLLTTANVVLWVRSYWKADLVGSDNVWSQPRERGWRVVAVTSSHGVVRAETYAFHAPRDGEPHSPDGPPGWYWRTVDPNPIGVETRVMGIPLGAKSSPITLVFTDDRRLVTGKPPVLGVYRAIWTPHWLIALLVATPALPIIWRGRIATRRARRIAAGRCAACGYDLRASNLRCPECGAETARAVHSSDAAAV